MCEHKGDFGNYRYAANAVFCFAFFNAQNLGFFIPVLPAQVLQLSAPQAGQKKGLQNELISNRELLCSFFKRLLDRKSTRLNSSHPTTSRMPSSA